MPFMNRLKLLKDFLGATVGRMNTVFRFMVENYDSVHCGTIKR